MQGAQSLILRLKPLIIFEYNRVSKKHYGLDEVRRILGGSYEIYRLRGDARLDDCVSEAWNCIAVDRDSIFYPIVLSLIKNGSSRILAGSRGK